MIPIKPLTELEAVNLMLSILGEAPIATLEDTGRVDAAVAVSYLRNTSRAVQSLGWVWNTDLAYPLTPSYPDGFLYVPNNTLRVDSVGADRQTNVVLRGTRLWDRKNHTFKFTQSLKVDLVLGLDFSEMPQAARDYITIRAGRGYQERFLGSGTVSDLTQDDEAFALATLRHEETENGDFNFLGSDPVRQILER